jgi:hypothetical protein
MLKKASRQEVSANAEYIEMDAWWSSAALRSNTMSAPRAKGLSGALVIAMTLHFCARKPGKSFTISVLLPLRDKTITAESFATLPK